MSAKGKDQVPLSYIADPAGRLRDERAKLMLSLESRRNEQFGLFVDFVNQTLQGVPETSARTCLNTTRLLRQGLAIAALDFDIPEIPAMIEILDGMETRLVERIAGTRSTAYDASAQIAAWDGQDVIQWLIHASAHAISDMDGAEGPEMVEMRSDVRIMLTACDAWLDVVPIGHDGFSEIFGPLRSLQDIMHRTMRR